MADRPLIHNVFFALADGSEERIASLTNACHKYLTNHPGVIFFAAGPLASELDRPVNIRDFHVGLTIAFASKADHDAYQVAPRHEEFIAEQKQYWSHVRVFDNYDGVA